MRKHERITAGIFSAPTTELDVAQSPCKLMPEFWDAPRFSGHGVMPLSERLRVENASAECHRCPALGACLKYVSGWDHPDGVVAGQVWLNGLRLA